MIDRVMAHAYVCMGRVVRRKASTRADNDLMNAGAAIEQLAGHVTDLLEERERIERDRDTAMFNVRALEDRLAEVEARER